MAPHLLSGAPHALANMDAFTCNAHACSAGAIRRGPFGPLAASLRSPNSANADHRNALALRAPKIKSGLHRYTCQSMDFKAESAAATSALETAPAEVEAPTAAAPPSAQVDTSSSEEDVIPAAKEASPELPATDAFSGVATESDVEEGAVRGAPSVESASVEPASASVETAAASVEATTQPEEEGDDTQFYVPKFVLLSAAKVVPHPAKVEKGGEDAFLISDVGAGVICVADGVGGWANDGVDPALYSKELMGHLEAAIDAAEAQEDLEPRTLLKAAHASTTSPGAATAVVAVYDGDQSTLEIANLGDSGVMVVRQGEVLFKTRSQQHYFDCPYQLGSESTDNPENAELYSVSLEEGDTVVMGSDGLFDNVFDKDIACVVKVFGGQDDTAVQRSATALAALASKHAGDSEYMSPYIIEAIEQGQDLPVWEKMLGKKLSGGKLDDITVVVSQVVRTGKEDQ